MIPATSIQHIYPSHSLKFRHKVLVELHNPARPLRPRRQERSPEVQRALLLSETTTRNNADARRVEHAEAVELVWGAVLLLGLLDGLLGELDGREEVH